MYTSAGGIGFRGTSNVTSSNEVDTQDGAEFLDVCVGIYGVYESKDYCDVHMNLDYTAIAYFVVAIIVAHQVCVCSLMQNHERLSLHR